MHTLAKKVLQIPIFLGFMILGFQLVGVFRVAGEVLEGRETMHLLYMAQVVAEVAVSKNSYELTILRAKLADEAVLTFAKQELVEIHSPPTLRVHFGSDVAMISKVSTRLACE